jgi:ketosteroid isomerase-like protein
MSQENMEQIVRHGYDAFNRGDLEACLTTIDPGIQWWPATDELIIEPYRGHDGYRRLFAESREGVPDIQAEVEELLVGYKVKRVAIDRRASENLSQPRPSTAWRPLAAHPPHRVSRAASA